MGKNATGQNLMLWMSTKCAACGEKKRFELWWGRIAEIVY